VKASVLDFHWRRPTSQQAGQARSVAAWQCVKNVRKTAPCVVLCWSCLRLRRRLRVFSASAWRCVCSSARLPLSRPPT
jgi:hypothetical protein